MKRTLPDHYSHRDTELDELLGKKLKITMPEGSYIGILEFDQGWYFMIKPIFQTRKAEKSIPIWKCRKKHIDIKNIRIIGTGVIK